MHFPEAIKIVDLYHARKHLHNLCALLLPGGSVRSRRLETRWSTALDEGNVDKIITEAQRCLKRTNSEAEAVEKEIGYFRNNASRMRYGDYRAQCLFVGSDVVEAGCKTVIFYLFTCTSHPFCL